MLVLHYHIMQNGLRDSVYYFSIKSVKSSKFLVEEGSVHFVNINDYVFSEVFTFYFCDEKVHLLNYNSLLNLQTMTEAEHNQPIPKLFSNRPSASAAEVFGETIYFKIPLVLHLYSED